MTRLAMGVLAAITALLASLPAHAQPVVRHHAEAGEPEVLLQLPLLWSRESSPSGMIVLSNVDRSALMSILLGKEAGTFDEIAAGIAKDVIGLNEIKRSDDLTVDGRSAARFLLDITRSNNQHFDSIMTLVRIDESWVMNISLTLNANITPSGRAEALAVIDTMKIVGH